MMLNSRMAQASLQQEAVSFPAPREWQHHEQLLSSY